MHYKKSQYNYFVPYKDNIILYNFYSNFTSIFTSPFFFLGKLFNFKFPKI